MIMNNEREIFLMKINEFIISSKSNNKKEFKSIYLKLVKEYHPDKNNNIDKNTLNEYMVIINNIYNESEVKSEQIIARDKQNDSKYFFINTFCQLISRIKTIYSNNKEPSDPQNGKYGDLVIREISKYNQKAGESFLLLLSQKTINRKDNDIYLKWITVYEQIFNNIYIYTKYYVRKKQKEGNNYFHEYTKDKPEEIKEAIEIITKWFDELIENIYKS
jgi:hypothetical protein